MKRVLIILIAAAFAAAVSVPTVLAQGEPNPPRSDVKSKKPKSSTQKKSDTKKPSQKKPGYDLK